MTPLLPDFRALFDASPGAYLVVLPDAPTFTIVEANAAYLAATMTRRADLVGRGLFEAFPDNPDDPNADGVRNLRASLETVVATRASHRMAVQRYDVRRPDGDFEERHWRPVNTPTFDGAGRVTHIVHHVEDVTALVRQTAARREAEREQRRLRALEGAARARAGLAEDRLRQVLERAPVAIAVLRGPRHVYEFVNAGYLALVGDRPLVGRPMAEAVPELAVPEVIDVLDRVFTTGERMDVPATEFRRTAPVPAEPRIVAWSVEPVLDELGAISGVVVVSNDVTELVRAREAADAERARLDAVLRQLPAGVILRGVDGRLILANAEVERLLGGPLNTALSEVEFARYRLRRPDGRPLPVEELAISRALARGEVVHGEELLLERPDGTTVRLSQCAGPIRDAAGRIVAAALTLTDYTELRRTEAALAESQERLEIALAAGRMGTFEWRIPEGRIVRSSGLERMHGYAPGAFVGTVEAYFAEIHPDDRARVGAHVEAVLAGTREHRIEYRIVRTDGTVLWVEGRGRLFRDEAGRPLRLVGVCADVTERRETEEAARRSQRLEAMGQLAAGMAHDTNNMMAAVLGYAQLVHRAPDLPPRHRRDLEEIIKAAERTSNLTRQLLTFSRRQLVAPEVLDLNGAVVELTDMLRRVLGTDILLDLRLTETPCWISFDRTQLTQVLLNLALNARDAMAQGGRLRIVTRHLAATRQVALDVLDTGQGMDEETRARIFEPFFTTKPLGRGTGLGLSTVHGIVTGAGGTIDVESAPGQGAAFRIVLPATDAPTSAEPAAGTAADAAPLRVLLVDDEAIVRALATRMLEEAGYRVEAAASGEEALRRLADDAAVDVLVTDLTMPGMNGLDLARRVRSSRPSLPILFITGHHGSTLDDHGLGDRVAVLQKPFSPEALAGAVERMAGRE